MSQQPSWVPKCPICRAVLEGVPFPLPRKGKGRCPAAGNYEFTAEVDDTKTVIDKFGNAKKSVSWNVEPTSPNQGHNE